jgi:hypothetical protein
MKKIALTLKRSVFSKIELYLFCLLAVCIQSCETARMDVKGSIDANKQRFSGPSYPNPSDNNFDPGINLGVSIVLAGSYAQAGSGSFYNKTRHSSYDKVYASTDKGPAAFFDPYATNTQPPTFMNSVLITGGLEYVLKRSSDASLSYLQVPLYALYYYRLDGAGSIFGGLGPYMAYGIGGSAFGGDDGLKRFDAGLGLTIGYKMPQSFSFSLGYDIGLANIQQSAFGDKAQNRGISLNVAYPLDKLLGKVKGK